MSTLKRKAGAQAGADAKKPKQNATITSFFGAPKVGPAAVAPPPAGGSSNKTSTAPDLPAVKFDKEKWVATLTPEQKKLLQLEIDTLHESWSCGGLAAASCWWWCYCCGTDLGGAEEGRDGGILFGFLCVCTSLGAGLSFEGRHGEVLVLNTEIS